MWGENADKKRESLFEEGIDTFLGKGVHFKGEVKLDGSVRIDGCFEGNIVAEGTLIIGEHGCIKGQIACENLLSSGKIEGDIVASQKVQLLKPAVLLGGIRTPSLSLEDGVLFRGMCDMGAGESDNVSSQADEGAETQQDLPEP